jgi:predicted enzyme related to lactoylglutathione lyase
MQNNPVGWFEIYVQDMARARKFYETVFEVKLEKLPAPDIELWAFPMSMERTGAGGALVRMEGFAPGGNSVLVYFSCEDCAVEASRVKQAGGRIQKEKMPIGEYGFIALVFDTEGNMLGLHSRR